MNTAPQLLLIGTVLAVGFLHTLVPDHWVPIVVVARQFGWTRVQTARAAALAGLGHTLSTLAIGVLVWLGGVALAMRFGNVVSLLSSAALIVFGLWIAVSSLREMQTSRLNEGEERLRFLRGDQRSVRVSLLLILGSSPMVEGIPAFFAAARFGAGLLAVMAACFAASTIVTYVVLCVVSQSALKSLTLGSFERYGEVLSGIIVAIVGVVFLIWPIV